MYQKVYLSSPEEPMRHWGGPLRGPGRETYGPDMVSYTRKCVLCGPAKDSSPPRVYLSMNLFTP